MPNKDNQIAFHFILPATMCGTRLIGVNRGRLRHRPRVTAICCYGGPIGQNRGDGRAKLTELFRRIDRFAADDRQHRFEVPDFLVSNRKIIVR
jgi:hypothetical protein